MIAWGVARETKIAASARGHFSREQTHPRPPCPLAEAEWPKELLLGVLERRSKAVNGRDRHQHLAKVNAMKVNCQAAWVKEDRNKKVEARMQNWARSLLLNSYF